MDVLTWTLFLTGLVLLVAGAEALVRGASRLAAAVGISPLVIGLTVVALGTSSPEMAVSVSAALSGQAGADLALGNVVGSNIFNVLFILGVSAIVTPLIVAQQLIRLDVPIMVGVSLLMFVMALDGRISRVDGLLLIAGIVVYTAFVLRQARRETNEQVKSEYEAQYAGVPASGASVWTNLLLVGVGLLLLVVGSRWLVDGATTIARALGVSELIIGLTIVALGTSLPEVATSVMASIRREVDIAVGNVVGSNIFNILAVLGLSSAIGPNGVNVPPSALAFDIPVMVAVAIGCLPILVTGHRIVRWEGVVFVAYAVAYTLFLVLDHADHDALPTVTRFMLWFVVPLTVLTMAVSLVRHFRTPAADRN